MIQLNLEPIAPSGRFREGKGGSAESPFWQSAIHLHGYNMHSRSPGLQS